MVMKRNKSWYAILGILTLGPRTGYDIKKFFDKSVAKFWNESYGQIYPLLKRLAVEKFVKKTVRKQVGRPDRHIYTITAKGREEIKKWLLTPVMPQIGRHEILLKLIFGYELGVTDSIRQIQHFQEQQRRDLQQTNELLEQMETGYLEGPSKPYMKLALRYGHRVNRAYLDWADEAIAALKALQKKDDENETD